MTGFEELTTKSGLYSIGRENQWCNKEIEFENGKRLEKAKRVKGHAEQS